VSILGTRVVRTEDPLFLTAGATYTDDLVDQRLAGAAFVTFIRSPFAHAKVLSIDAGAALALDGVVTVVTAADLTDVPTPAAPFPGLPAVMAQPLLAGDTVRFAGQPVAAVVTDSRFTGEDAAELVVVDYEPLPVVVDPEDAARDEVLIYPEAGTNTAAGNNLDVEPAPDLFDGCDVVVTHRILNQRVAPAPMEVRAGAAVIGDDGRLIAWVPNQGAQLTQGALARMLGLPRSQVRVITPDVGGGFGAKFGADVEHAVLGLLARRLGRPVRWVETRSENLLAMTHGRGQVNTVTIGGTRDGKVLAYRLEVLQDCGAYTRFGAMLPELTAMMAPGVYDIPRVETRTRSVVTNTTPIGAYRGAGRPEATAAIERAIDLFSAELGLDPAQVRRRNLLPRFETPIRTVTGARYDSGDYAAALEKALEAADYQGLRAEQAARRECGDAVQLGIGLAVYVEITGSGMEAGNPNENADVEVHPDGSATVLTGTSPHGQGHATAWAMLVSEELGIQVDRITVRHGDTDLVPRGGGTAGSRSLQQGGAAVQQAARELLDLAKRRAAELLEASPDDIEPDPQRQGLAVRGAPHTAISLAELASRDRLHVHTVFTAPGPTFPFGAHVAVVEVDTESGRASLRRLVAVDDAGTVLNPLLAEGQRHGGIAQGVAQALYEEVVYDPDGNPLTGTFASYPFLSITEVPSFDLVDLATPTSYNPLGAKGIGESGAIGSTPAVQNAVVDAVSRLGVRHIDLPCTPQRVWEAIGAATADDEGEAGA
jgi:carbon-monoxide dehydrogenase large subunit